MNRYINFWRAEGDRAAFTIVELIVVIVIIGILSTLVTVQVSRSQLLARDNERENDVKIIAGVIEEVHNSGQINGVTIPSGDAAVTESTAMTYPSTRLISDASDVQSLAIIGAIDPEALKSPLKGGFSLEHAVNGSGASGSTAGGKTIGPVTSNDIYVYQPLKKPDPDVICNHANPSNSNQKVIAPRYANSTNTCIQFFIYYYSEITSSIKTYSSKDSSRNGL